MLEFQRQAVRLALTSGRTRREIVVDLGRRLINSNAAAQLARVLGSVLGQRGRLN